jgi:hypothetical protein
VHVQHFFLFLSWRLKRIQQCVCTTFLSLSRFAFAIASERASIPHISISVKISMLPTIPLLRYQIGLEIIIPNSADRTKPRFFQCSS